jgi:arylformamidase
MTDADRSDQARAVPFDQGWIDVSVPVRPGMIHWPDDPMVEIRRVADIADGSMFNLSTIRMSVHTGTHIDAPLHVIQGGLTTEQMPLSAMVGTTRVIEIAGQQGIEPEVLQDKNIQPGERLLFRTSNSQHEGKTDRFVETYAALGPRAAAYLVQRKVRTVGIDALSIGPYGQEGEETHRILLNAGIWVIEGLDLAPVKAGLYEMVCLPMRLLDTEGAPARAILRPVKTS